MKVATTVNAAEFKCQVCIEFTKLVLLEFVGVEETEGCWGWHIFIREGGFLGKLKFFCEENFFEGKEKNKNLFLKENKREKYKLNITSKS